MNNIRAYQYKITTQHVDFQRKVSLSSLFHLILRTTSADADNKGFGLTKLQSENYTWVLSRFVMDLERYPEQDDEITIETWIQDVESFFTTRNFRITNGNKQVIGYASSSWAIIDMETRKSVLLDTIPLLKQFIANETTPIGIPARIPNIDGEVANRFEVKYSHIDMNNHASSPFYIQWIADCFSLDFYQKNRPKRIEVNFLKEITFGDIGEVYREIKSEKEYFFQIVTKEKGTTFRARLLF